MSRWHNIDGFADLPLGAFQAEQIGLTAKIKLHGGSGSTTSTTSNLPTYAEPYFKTLMAEAQAEYVKPYDHERAAGFERVAQISPAEQQYGTQIYGREEDTGLAAASTNLGRVSDAMLDPTNKFTSTDVTAGYTGPGDMESGYTAGTSTAGKWTDPGEAAAYMSPYQQQVTDIEKREAQRQAGIAGTGIGYKAQQAGAFGGGRHGLVEAEHGRNLAQQLGDIQTRGSQQAYDRGAAQFGADRAAQMKATGQTQGFQQAEGAMNLTAAQQTEAAKQAAGTQGLEAAKQTESSKQYAAKHQQQAQDQGIKVAAAREKLGKTRETLEAARLKLKMSLGREQRALAQKDLDKIWNDYVNDRDSNRQQLAFYNSLMRGMPMPLQSEVRQVGPAPSTLGQLGGLGIGALGAFNAFGGGHVGRFEE
jgi:hypothetical protein